MEAPDLSEPGMKTCRSGRSGGSDRSVVLSFWRSRSVLRSGSTAWLGSVEFWNENENGTKERSERSERPERPERLSYQNPSNRHHAPPIPSQIAMLTTLTIAPTRHQSASEQLPLPKRIGAGAVP